MGKKLNLDINEINNLYLNKKMSFENIGKLLNCSGSTIARYYKKNGGKVRTNAEQATKYFFNEYYFDTLTPESAYWLGFLYADGYITKNNIIGIKLKITDKEHLQAFLNALNSNHPINEYIAKGAFGECHYGTITLHSNHMFNRLIELGVIKNKSLILTFPTINQVPHNLIPHFIRGYFDGDGTVFKRNNKYLTVSFIGTLEFLQELQKHLNNKGHLYNESRNTNNTYYLNLFDQNDILWFKNYIYDTSTIHLERKHIIFS